MNRNTSPGGSSRKRVVVGKKDQPFIEKYGVQSIYQQHPSKSSKVVSFSDESDKSQDDIQFDSDDNNNSSDNSTGNQVIRNTSYQNRVVTNNRTISTSNESRSNNINLFNSNTNNNNNSNNTINRRQQTTETTITSSNNQNSNKTGFFSKIFKWSSYPTMLLNFSILSFFKMESLNGDDHSVKETIKKIFYAVLLSVFGLLVVFLLTSVSSIGLPNRFFNGSSTTSTVYVEKQVKLDKETLFPLFEEYFRSKKINEKFESIQVNINELVSNLNNKDDYNNILQQLQEKFDSIKDDLIDEKKVETIVAKYNDKDQILEAMTNEIKDISEKKINELKQIISQKTSEFNKISLEKTNEFNEISQEKTKHLNQISQEKSIELQKQSKSIIEDQKQAIEGLKSEINSLSKENRNEIHKEYDLIQEKLDSLQVKITNDLKISTQSQIEIGKEEVSRQVTQNIENQNNQLNLLHFSITNKLEKIQNFINDNPNIKNFESSMDSINQLKFLIDDALELYSSDKIGKADYALIGSGACVEYRAIHYPISETYPSLRASISNDLINKALSWWSRPAQKPNPPEVAFEPTVSTGSCWGFLGSNGRTVVRLSQPIIVSEVSVDHINSKISHHIDSAPKEFKVIGLKNSTDNGTDLGTFEYLANINRHIQTFKVNNPNSESFSHVVFEVLSNYGFRYTCIYRFRAHGEPDPNFFSQYVIEQEKIQEQIEELQALQELNDVNNNQIVEDI